MSAVSHYWQLQRLESSGRCRLQSLEIAQTWFHNQFPTATADTPGRTLQAHLFAQWRQGEAIALLCLRCFVSHAIRQACLQLVSQFGAHYQFRGADLFPYVLDDDGQPLGSYRPLSLQILETYTPGKASLESWAMNLTRNQDDLNQFLLGQGLYRISEWAILNDTQPSQLPRILGEFHTLSAAEVTAAQTLLLRYHEVYRRDRFQQRQGGRGGRCLPPTEAQLRQINPAIAPQTGLAKLRQLAYWLRQYRIHARGGTPLAESFEALNEAELPAAAPHDTSSTEEDFLQSYHQQFQAALAEAVTATLIAYQQKLQRKQPAKDAAFLRALALFHCEGKGMKAIATQVGLTNQVQVTRLMNLGRLRAEIRNALLSRLQQRIQSKVLAVTSLERLQAIGDQLDRLLAEAADQVIAEDAAKAKIPQNRTPDSQLSRQICKSLHPLLPTTP